MTEPVTSAIWKISKSQELKGHLVGDQIFYV